MNKPNENITHKYDAFISYSRKDIKFAEKLEKALENYTPPKDINLPNRHLNIFHDVSDMTGIEYFQAISEHLKNSDKLILICSPNARGSEMVNDEIRRFAKQKGPENIITILLSGIPNNEANEEQEYEKAFPESLCSLMKIPLAIDYRNFNPKKNKVNKGDFKNSWHMLLANIYGITREEVEQREKARQKRQHRRRVTIISTTIMLFLIIGFFGLIQLKEKTRKNRIAISQDIAAKSHSLLDSRYDLALLLSVEAFRFANTYEAQKSILAAFNKKPKIFQLLRGNHLGAIFSIKFSKDGNFFASCDGNGKIILWDAKSNSILSEFIPKARTKKMRNGNRPPMIFDIAFSPSGNTLASASEDGSIHLWDIQNHRSISGHNFGHTDVVTSIIFHDTEKYLVSGSRDGTIIFWDLEEYKQARIIHLGEDIKVESLAFDPTGRILASGDSRGNIVLWDQNGEPIDTLNGHSGGINSLAFNPKGDVLASSSGKGGITFWNVDNQTVIADIAAEDKVSFYRITFHPTGKILAVTTSGGKVLLYRCDNYKQMGEPLDFCEGLERDKQYCMPFCAAFNPNGNFLVSGGGSGMICIWNLETSHQLMRELPPLHKGVLSVSFNPNGRQLATAGFKKPLIVWDIKTQSPIRYLIKKKELVVWSIKYNSKGNSLCAGCNDGTIYYYNINSDQFIGKRLKKHIGPVYSLDFSPDDRILASGGADSTIVLWNLDTYVPLGTPLKGHSSEVISLNFSPNGKYLISASNRDVFFWDINKRERINKLENFGSSVSSSILSPNGKKLATGHPDGSIMLWDVAAFQKIGESRILHEQAVWCLAFSPDSKILVSGSHDGKIIFWEVESLQPISLFNLKGEPKVECVCFDQEGKYMACGSRNNGSVILWDVNFSSWLKKACRITNRNLTKREWKQFFPGLKYHKTCPDITQPEE